jgi:hypothetical protein
MSEPEPVPVADQRAAGVHPDDTVTIADQRAGVPPPELPDPDAEPAVIPTATTNESAKLPPNLTSSAAKAHAMLAQAIEVGDDAGKVLAIVQLALAELEKFMPDHVRAPAQVEASAAVDRL